MEEAEYRQTLQKEIEQARADHENAVRVEVAAADPQTLKAAPQTLALIARGKEAATAFTSLADVADPANNAPVLPWQQRQTIHGARRALHNSILFDERRTPDERIQSLNRLAKRFGLNIDLLKRAIRLLQNRNEDVALRRAVLMAIQAATFFASADQLAVWRPIYFAALRQVADTSTDALASNALQTLAVSQDSWALDKLRDGIQDPSKAVLPPAEAISYLAADDHGDHYDTLLRIAGDKQEEFATRRAAVQALASDPAARDLLLQILKDASEPVELRAEALFSLRVADNDVYKTEANRIIEDSAEEPSLRAAAITTLGLDNDEARDKRLADSIKVAGDMSSPAVLQQAVSQYFRRPG